MGKSVFWLALLLALFAVVACRSNARASEVEYCPAYVYGHQRLGGADGGVSSFAVAAYSARTVNGEIAVQTNEGWFAVPFAPVALVPVVGHYEAHYVSFERNDFVSKELFVRFPSGVTTTSKWFVQSAQASGDAFDWQAKGRVECPAPAGLGLPGALRRPDNMSATRTNHSPLDLTAAPGANDVVVAATPIAAPGSIGCAHPFTYARVTAAVQPSFPDSARGVSLPREAQIEIAVSSGGSIDGAWVYQPTGVQALDLTAMRSARLSHYAAGSAFCLPAPGLYLFNAMFTSRRFP